jgi:hypothetical protein
VRRLCLLLCVALTLAASVTADADDGPRFHRTTSHHSARDVRRGGWRAGHRDPGGRAWGIESELRALPPVGTTLLVRLAVSDDAVREAFVGLAYYASASTRARQLATVDSAPVAGTGRASVAIPLEPPPLAVAFRVRVLARLADPAGRSVPGAVTAALRWSRGAVRPAGSLLPRLVE